MSVSLPTQDSATLPATGRRRRPGRGTPLITVPRVLVLLALAVLGVTIPSIRSAGSTEFGLLFANTPGLTASVVLLAIALCVAVRQNRPVDLTVVVAAFVLAFRLPVVLGTEYPIGASTYKLLGVVDYIMQNGVTASGVDIYNRWAGAFTAIAWLSQVTGVDPLDMAHWFPLLVEFAFAAAVYALARSFGQSPVVALVAAFVAQTVNWVGQDYMSPQAVAIVLAVLILALLRGSRDRPSLGWLTLPLFVAMTVTHQLTPYWLIGIALVLGVTGHIRPRWLGVVFGLVAGAFLAANFGALANYGLFSGFDPVENAQLIVNGTGGVGLAFTGIAIKVTSGAVWGGAALAALLRLRADRRISADNWTAVVFAFSPLALLLAQSYGGEAIFRVYLYSLAGCAVLVAPLIVAMIQSAGSFVRRLAGVVIASLLVLVVSLGALQSFYGGWFSLLVHKDSVDEMAALLRSAEPPATILGLAPIAPNRPVAEYTEFARADRNFDESLPILRPEWGGHMFGPDAPAQLAAQFGNTGGPVYLMTGTETLYYNEYYKLYPDGAIEALVDDLRESTQWVTLTDTPTLQLFELRSSAR